MPSQGSCPRVMLRRIRGGVWQCKSKSLRHLEDHEEEYSNAGISTSVLDLGASAFAVWAVQSHLAIQSLFCHAAARAFGERRLWVMSLQLSWGFTSLCTTAGNTLCIASPWKQLCPLTCPRPFSFKIKLKAAATRVISSILMLMMLP